MTRAITIEQARAVVEAHDKELNAKKVAEQRQFIGRFFKYANHYSSGEEWWLYAMPTAVSEYGRLTGLTFQHTASDSIEIMREDSLSSLPGGGWTEITDSEFWTAASSIRGEVYALLSRYKDAP